MNVLLRAATLLLLAAAGSARAQLPPAMADRLQPCTACHGQNGRATSAGYFPRIAGKPAGYLYNQLVNFQLGRRRYAAMADLVEHLSDDYLREIAGAFAALELPYAAPQPPAAAPPVLARGAALVRRGARLRGLPACAACHGERLTGVEPAVPGLVGLPRDYVVAQLGGWRTGQRRAAEPDCMAAVAERLSADDVVAVAAWLAAQPLPPDTHAAPASTRPLPLSCGSER